jgi:hypothetical protein
VLLYIPSDHTIYWNSVACNAVILECRSRTQLDVHVPAITVARQPNAAAYSILDEWGQWRFGRLATAWVSFSAAHQYIVRGMEMSILLVI